MRQRFNEVSEQASDGMRTVYTSARNSPKATAAIVLGIGAIAALLWLARRSDWRAMQSQVVDRVREGYGTARAAIKDRATRLRRHEQQLVE